MFVTLISGIREAFRELQGAALQSSRLEDEEPRTLPPRIIEVSDQNSNWFPYLFLLVGRSKEPGDHGSRKIPKEIRVEILLRNLIKDESQYKNRSRKPPTEEIGDRDGTGFNQASSKFPL